MNNRTDNKGRVESAEDGDRLFFRGETVAYRDRGMTRNGVISAMWPQDGTTMARVKFPRGNDVIVPLSALQPLRYGLRGKKLTEEWPGLRTGSKWYVGKNRVD